MTQRLIGVIGGTGVGQAVAAAAATGRAHEVDTPFGRPSAPLVVAEWCGAPIVFLARHGPAHTLPPSAVPYQANIWALKSMGVTHIIASGATGSLREEIRPRDLVVPDQIIDRTYRRAGSFFNEPGVAVHVEFAEPFCPELRRRLLNAAGATARQASPLNMAAGAAVHDGGTYVCMEGPAFSTVAESRMHRASGGDLIGMTVCPEAKLAREAQMCYALLALPTDYDCWRPHDPTRSREALLVDILRNLRAVTDESVKLLEPALADLAAHPPGDCACQHSLERAVWTDRGRIDPAARARLKLLLGS